MDAADLPKVSQNEYTYKFQYAKTIFPISETFELKCLQILYLILYFICTIDDFGSYSCDFCDGSTGCNIRWKL